MLNIKQEKEGEKLTIVLDGRLDTTSAPQLEGELKSAVDGITSLVFEIGELAYISSAGLRVLLSAQKVMNRQGEMVIRGANEDVMEIFEVTGFSDILNIEK